MMSGPDPTTPSSDDQGVEYATPTSEYLRQRLQTMDPSHFEEFVADAWGELGWETRTVGEPGDRGIDVIATDGDGKQLIQAKRYGPETTVGSPEVQQYASLQLQENGVDDVVIVTTETFSQQARPLASELDVTLVDDETLLEMPDELEGYEVFVEHFDDIHVAGDEHSRGGMTGTEAGVMNRLREWLGW
ncbi:restriction endonuclease [Halobaculum sp. MBLA0147]|uniref:restriction endonuclease n=1 Tax=Halobaculum sp. MBLA0147 TaxID=3079934 RepID=UPI00352451DD